MVKGTLRNRGGIYYVILYWQKNGKQKQFPFSTKIPVKGMEEEMKAKMALYDARLNFDPSKIEEAKDKYLTRKSNKIRIKINEETLPDISFLTFLEWALEIYLKKNKHLSVATKNGYIRVVKKIKEYKPFKYINFSDIKRKDIEIFFDYCFTFWNFAPATVVGIRTRLGVLYNIAVERELVEYNLIYKSKKIFIRKKPKNTLNKEKIKIFLESLKNNPFELEFNLLIFYGLRKSEILGLKEENVNFIQKNIEIRQSLIWDDQNRKYIINEFLKNAPSHRIFPFFSNIEKLLLERIERIKKDKLFFGNTYGTDLKLKFNADGYICVDAEGKILKIFRLNYELDKLLKKCSLGHMTVHELRHTCATLLYLEGVDIKDIQHWLGHSNISTTANIYTHFDNSKNFQVIKKMENALGINT